MTQACTNFSIFVDIYVYSSAVDIYYYMGVGNYFSSGDKYACFPSYIKNTTMQKSAKTFGIEYFVHLRRVFWPAWSEWSREVDDFQDAQCGNVAHAWESVF